MILFRSSFIAIACIWSASLSIVVSSFQQPSSAYRFSRYVNNRSSFHHQQIQNIRPTTTLFEKYSREVILREEAESPFRKVRFFFYYSLGGGALTSLFVSVTRILAALNGINVELLDESLINAAVDLLGIIVLGFAFRQDLQAQESRYKRATKGAELAKLTVRGNKSMILNADVSMDEEMSSVMDSSSSKSNTFQTTLAGLRRGRGIEKRVIIAAAGIDKIKEVVQETNRIKDELFLNDLLVVPVVMPGAVAPDIASLLGDEESLPDCMALPVGNNWKAVMQDEQIEADKQGIDVIKEGICVIVKKNGRVGQRTKGIFLANMVGDVEARKSSGMDVSNI